MDEGTWTVAAGYNITKDDVISMFNSQLGYPAELHHQQEYILSVYFSGKENSVFSSIVGDNKLYRFSPMTNQQVMKDKVQKLSDLLTDVVFVNPIMSREFIGFVRMTLKIPDTTVVADVSEEVLDASIRWVESWQE